MDPGDERWKAVEASDAWEDVKSNWKTYWEKNRDKDPRSFTQVTDVFFNTLINRRDCSLMFSRSNCQSPQQCVKGLSAAGQFIMDSFVTIHEIFADINTILYQAKADIDGQIGDFSDTFAPDNKEDGFDATILLDYLPMGYGGAIAPVWKALGSKFKFADGGSKQGKFDKVTSLVDEMVNFGLGKIKDSIAKDEFDAKNKLEQQVGEMTFVCPGGPTRPCGCWRSSSTAAARASICSESSSPTARCSTTTRATCRPKAT